MYEERENDLLICNSGVGKTHIATALGYKAYRQGIRVKFYTIGGLIPDHNYKHRIYKMDGGIR